MLLNKGTSLSFLMKQNIRYNKCLFNKLIFNLSIESKKKSQNYYRYCISTGRSWKWSLVGHWSENSLLCYLLAYDIQIDSWKLDVHFLLEDFLNWMSHCLKISHINIYLKSSLPVLDSTSSPWRRLLFKASFFISRLMGLDLGRGRGENSENLYGLLGQG